MTAVTELVPIRGVGFLFILYTTCIGEVQLQKYNSAAKMKQVSM